MRVEPTPNEAPDIRIPLRLELLKDTVKREPGEYVGSHSLDEVNDSCVRNATSVLQKLSERKRSEPSNNVRIQKVRFGDTERIEAVVRGTLRRPPLNADIARLRTHTTGGSPAMHDRAHGRIARQSLKPYDVVMARDRSASSCVPQTRAAWIRVEPRQR